MTTSDMIREFCEKNISLAELCRRIGRTPQNFNKELQRGVVGLDELLSIADILGVLFEHGFTLSDGQSNKIYSRKNGGQADEK